MNNPLNHKTTIDSRDIDVQALRGIAVLLVFFNHANLLDNGFLGVDIFFVIWGYIIASSLSKRYKKFDLIFLRSFIYRRIVRLLPSLLISLVLISSLFLSLDFLGIASIRTAISIFGLSNLYLARINNDYFVIDQGDNPFVPTWSLGVEEQSYLFLGIILVLGLERYILPKQRISRLVTALNENIFILICILSSILIYFITLRAPRKIRTSLAQNYFDL